jgi:hypothetical protein
MILVENGTRIACLAWRLWSGRSPPCCDNVSMYFHITLWYTVPCTYRKTEGRAVRYDQLQARVGRPMLPAPSLCNSGRIWSRSVAAGACRTAGVATNKHIPTRAEQDQDVPIPCPPACMPLPCTYFQVPLDMHCWMIVSQAGRTRDTAGDERKGSKGAGMCADPMILLTIFFLRSKLSVFEFI